MEPTRDIMEKLKKMDDAQLRELISEVARASGMNDGARRAAMAHTGMIRRKLQNVSESDFNRAMDQIGTEKAEQILRKLKN